MADGTPSNPFRIIGPAVINFSGGRTSGRMLRCILDAHGGVLPDDVVVCFANTGEESEATYRFIQDCGEKWQVPIHWIEFRHSFLNSNRRRSRWAERVTFETASRRGEPFDALLESKRIVPDRRRRFCTQELKVLTIRRYLLRTLGWDNVLRVIGFRADESVRIDNWRLAQATMRHPERAVFPLAEAGVQTLDVIAFWANQNFRLELDRDGDGGNCGSLCFMRSAEQIGRMAIKDPERCARWVARERRWGTKTMAPGRSYASVRATAEAQGVLPWDDAADCSAACGA